MVDTRALDWRVEWTKTSELERRLYLSFVLFFGRREKVGSYGINFSNLNQ
jgi:hypothetical protein